jgi:hypothetical protein
MLAVPCAAFHISLPQEGYEVTAGALSDHGEAT